MSFKPPQHLSWTLTNLIVLTLVSLSGCSQIKSKLQSVGLLPPDKQNNTTTGSAGAPVTDTPPVATVPGGNGSNNAKIFINNPVAMAMAPIAYNFSFSANGGYTFNPPSPINFDSYLATVSLTGTVGGYLQNSDITVKTDYVDSTGLHTSTIARATADTTGNWFFPTELDNDHKLGQLMAYYWIDQEKKIANNTLPNSWASAAKNITVYSHCYDANSSYGLQGPGLNAFWAGSAANYTCLSYASHFEAAYDGSVFVHEMGHSNIDFGTNGQIHTANQDIVCPFNNGAYCCKSNLGCAAAINEGQADTHSFIVFNTGRVGQFFLNNIKGLNVRDAQDESNLTAQAVFAGTGTDPVSGQAIGQFGQEIHEMGGVWGAAWWTLRQNLGPAVSDKIFFAHLPLLTGDDNFSTALQAIVIADQTLVTNGIFALNHKSAILAAFSQHGIQ